MPKLTQIIKPSEINVSDHFWSSDWEISEAETNARVLVIYCIENGDTFDQEIPITDKRFPAFLEDTVATVNGKMILSEEFVRRVLKFKKK